MNLARYMYHLCFDVSRLRRLFIIQIANPGIVLITLSLYFVSSIQKHAAREKAELARDVS